VIARGDEVWEALFLKRHHKSGFMANAYVFPGGRVDGSDASEENLARIKGLDLETLCDQMDGVSTAVEAASYVIAVVRETFEEAGILLARDRTGRWVDFTEGPTAKRFAQWRNQLNAGETSFERLLMDEDLCIAGEGLHYFDHWVTPAQESRRYDARFFVVSAPPKQRGRHDGHETTESVWHTPAGALAAHADGELMLPPPTWRVLMDLVRWTKRGDMLKALSVDPGVIRTEPRMIQDDGALALALPGDPEHGESQGRRFGARRIVLEAGAWVER
jgi:8-oxo-dGTP pyrophosphatase MutT (NUDIX family)